MKAMKWMLVMAMGAFLAAPVALAQDDAYVTPSRAREIRKKELREQELARQRRNERISEIERQKQEAERAEAEKRNQYANDVDDWYNRRNMDVSTDEMEQNLDKLDGKSNGKKPLGKYGQRLRRFSDNDDIIVLDSSSRIYVIDDFDYYDPWTSSYYGRDWDSGVNVIINYGPSWGYYPRSYGWGGYYSWSYPWYDSWYDPWFDPWYRYDPCYRYNPWYRYDPWYYGGWGWRHPRYYGGYWGGYWGGYYGSYWDGYYDGRRNRWYDDYYSVPYSRYGRSSGNYSTTRRSAASNQSVRTRSAHDQIYGRALGNTTTSSRTRDRYERAANTRTRSIFGTSDNSGTSRRYEGNTNRSSTRYNRSGTTNRRSYESTTRTRSSSYNRPVMNSNTNRSSVSRSSTTRSSSDRSFTRSSSSSSSSSRSSGTTNRSSGTTSRRSR